VLGEAVLQRTAQRSATSIWLSGGRDSTAVFAAGQHAIARTGLGATLQPVSLRLAADDPFNEDRFIEATASYWQSSVTWLEVADLGPMIDTDRAGERDEPHGHVYENLMRKLAEKSLVTGSRVALTGHGGDFLFEVSAVILADYLASLRIPSLIREWGALGTQRFSVRALLHWGITPILPPIVQRLVTRWRGRPLRGYFERPVPSWLDPSFVKQHDLVERARAGTPRAPNGSRAAYEMTWFLTQPRLGRLGAICAEHALETGVEQRSPILDMRVIRLAASRPGSERRKNGQTKLLLRRAMIGLLPESVLAPRTFKTGTLASYSGQAIMALAPVMCREFRDSILGALGLVRESELLKSAERLRAGTATRYMAEQLLRAFQCELWLKARSAVPRKAPMLLDSQFSERSAMPVAV
jgi:asparagine synthase (glutamine-hydrolysing)